MRDKKRKWAETNLASWELGLEKNCSRKVIREGGPCSFEGVPAFTAAGVWSVFVG